MIQGGSLISKYKGLSVQAKSAIWFVACSLLQKGISFITVPIFTRIMTPVEYGDYSLYLSWLQIMTIVTSLYLFCGTFDNAMSKFEEDRDRYISSMQGLSLVIWGIVFLVFFISRKLWVSAIGLPPVFIYLMFAEMLLTPAMSFWSGRQKFEYFYKRLVLVSICKSVANPVLGIIFVLLAKDKVLARVVSVLIVEMVFSGLIMCYQYLKGKTFFNKKYWCYGLKLAIPMLPHYLSGIVLNQGDRIMIGHMVGSDAVAYYSVAYSIGMLVQILTQAINSSMTPWFYKRFKTDTTEEIKVTVNFLLVFIIFVVLCLMLISPELILVFGSKDYISGQYVIPPVAASVFFIFLYGIFSLPQFYYEKTKFLMMASVVAALVNVGLNYIFINLFGFIAAGYTTLACYVLYSIGHYLVSRKILRNMGKKDQMYDMKLIVLASLAVIVFAVAINITFPYIVVRYAILLVLLTSLILKRNVVLHYLSSIK